MQDLWLDACSYIHAVQNVERGNLSEDIEALQKIRVLYESKKIDLSIGLNVFFEINGPDAKRAKEFWKEVKPCPQEIGLRGYRIPSSNAEYERHRNKMEDILSELKRQCPGKADQDLEHLVNAAYFGGIFITTDYKFLNKLRNEGRHWGFKVLRPSEYVASINSPHLSGSA